MDDDQTRTHAMAVRTCEFMAQRLTDFAPTGAARQLHTDLINARIMDDSYTNFANAIDFDEPHI